MCQSDVCVIKHGLNNGAHYREIETCDNFSPPKNGWPQARVCWPGVVGKCVARRMEAGVAPGVAYQTWHHSHPTTGKKMRKLTKMSSYGSNKKSKIFSGNNIGRKNAAICLWNTGLKTFREIKPLWVTQVIFMDQLKRTIIGRMDNSMGNVQRTKRYTFFFQEISKNQ